MARMVPPTEEGSTVPVEAEVELQVEAEDLTTTLQPADSEALAALRRYSFAMSPLKRLELTHS